MLRAASLSRRTKNKSARLVLVTVLSLACAWAQAVVIPVNCGDTVVGNISVDVSGTGISGGFKSSVGGPPATLAAAAAACHEDHFNWYQIVTADNFPPKDAKGNQIPVPPPAYVDPPPGGYSDQWADNVPWYWDETRPPAGTSNFDPALQLSAQTTADTLKFSDFPGGQAGTNLSFKTWLVSLKADSSFDSFHQGFSWNWSNASGTGVVSGITSLGANVFPTDAEYKNIIGGFAKAVPEPGTFVLLAVGLLLVASRYRTRQ
jgi:hypothetical protein